MKITKIKGFSDLFSPESLQFTYMESVARSLFSACGFSELRTPLLEHTELFKRSIGEETDVVHKEMYTLVTGKGNSLTLRPEATAGVMRAYIENALYSQQQISRLFTMGPMFRHERPQKGRLRQFHQINCECLGSESPLCDADMICMLMRFLKTIGITDTHLEINSLGCPACRPRFKEALLSYLHSVADENLCEDCKRRIETNPLRVLDCKNEKCIAITDNAPHLADFLCDDCKDHFSTVLSLLDAQNIPYVRKHKLVRGLDYYCRTTFEVVSGDIGSQSAIAGGGRYDGLVHLLGGPEIPGIGFACGMERLALLLPQKEEEPIDFYILVLEQKGVSYAFTLLQKLREQGLRGEMNFQIASFKSLFRQADKSKARYCVILGSDELEKHVLTIKNMRDGSQQTLDEDAVFVLLQQK